MGAPYQFALPIPRSPLLKDSTASLSPFLWEPWKEADPLPPPITESAWRKRPW